MKSPETIYLQVCDDTMSEWCGEITWCEDRVHEGDVKYIRADVVEKLAEMNTSLMVDNNHLRGRIKELEASK